MGAQLRALRSRIRSVKSTAKITRAQELIAASRISKAQERLNAAKPYARQITRAVSALVSHHVHLDHPLLSTRSDRSRVAVLVVTSDRGFAGAYNNNVLKRADQLAAKLRAEGSEPFFYLTGSKGVDYFTFRDREITRSWTGISGEPTYRAAAEIGQVLTDAFVRPTGDGGVGEVHVVYNEFVSMLTQATTVRRILPLEIEEVERRDVGPGEIPPAYEFDPSPALVLSRLLRQYVHGRIWHMLLEAAASEHAARRQAMMSATDNANNLINELSRRANEARQEEITNELSEIVGGANALTDKSVD